MSLTTINGDLEKAVQGAEVPRVVLDWVLATYRHVVDKLEPTPAQVKKFLPLFASVVRLDKLTYLGLKRADVIDDIRTYYDSAPVMPWYRHIDRERFYVQLAFRVRHPSMINQGNSDWCGPVSLLASFAKRDPGAYAKFAHELFVNGSSSLHGSRIAPPKEVLEGYLWKMPEVDYVTLSAVRCMEAMKHWFFSPQNVKNGMNFMDFAKALEMVGYTRVHQHQAVWSGASLPGPSIVARSNLQSARDSQVKGRAVFFNVNASFIKHVQRAADTSHMTFTAQNPVALPSRVTIMDPGNHWVLANKLELDTAQNQLRLRFTTWGQKLEATMAIEEFLKFYGGYVSAQA